MKILEVAVVLDDNVGRQRLLFGNMRKTIGSGRRRFRFDSRN